MTRAFQNCRGGDWTGKMLMPTNSQCQLGFAAADGTYGWGASGDPPKGSSELDGYTKTETTTAGEILHMLNPGPMGGGLYGPGF